MQRKLWADSQSISFFVFLFFFLTGRGRISLFFTLTLVRTPALQQLFVELCKLSADGFPARTGSFESAPARKKKNNRKTRPSSDEEARYRLELF